MTIFIASTRPPSCWRIKEVIDSWNLFKKIDFLLYSNPIKVNNLLLWLWIIFQWKESFIFCSNSELLFCFFLKRGKSFILSFILLKMFLHLIWSKINLNYVMSRDGHGKRSNTDGLLYVYFVFVDLFSNPSFNTSPDPTNEPKCRSRDTSSKKHKY